MQDLIRRTFHLPTQESYTLDVREAGDHVLISIGPDNCSLSKEQFDLLCELRYKIDWTPDQLDLPL
jgi:hypothetical protein